MHRNDPFDRITGRGWVEPGEDGPCGGAGPLRRAVGVPPSPEGEDLSPYRPDPVFTPALKLRFLDELSRHGNVRVAAGRVGVSRSGLYLARRRDAEFDAGWRAALCLARGHAEAVLAERALEGVEEPVFFRGELIATRRRYDTRLLLAHLARLDALCAKEDAADGAHAARFDRTLAALGGLPEARRAPAASRDQTCRTAQRRAEMRGESLRRSAAAGTRAGAAWDAAEAAVHGAVDRAVDAAAVLPGGSGPNRAGLNRAGQDQPAEFKSLVPPGFAVQEPCPLCPPRGARGLAGADVSIARPPSPAGAPRAKGTGMTTPPSSAPHPAAILHRAALPLAAALAMPLSAAAPPVKAPRAPAPAPVVKPAPGPHHAPPGYVLVWADEFYREGRPDPARWTAETQRNKDGWYNAEAQYYSAGDPANAREERGVLAIEARAGAPGTAAVRPADWGGQVYTSARLTSGPKSAWTYGWFEVRAKIACGRGIWPAIWMLPADPARKWPDDGEIDIMEHVGHDPGVVHHSVHTRAFNHIAKTQKTAVFPLADACGAMHRYQLHWTADRITMGVDDTVRFTFARQGADRARWPFDKPMRLLLNVAVGGTWGGEKGIDPAAFPARMEVDYVRVYQKRK